MLVALKRIKAAQEELKAAEVAAVPMLTEILTSDDEILREFIDSEDFECLGFQASYFYQEVSRRELLRRK
jgi:hypothetical protein